MDSVTMDARDMELDLGLASYPLENIFDSADGYTGLMPFHTPIPNAQALKYDIQWPETSTSITACPSPEKSATAQTIFAEHFSVARLEDTLEDDASLSWPVEESGAWEIELDLAIDHQKDAAGPKAKKPKPKRRSVTKGAPAKHSRKRQKPSSDPTNPPVTVKRECSSYDVQWPCESVPSAPDTTQAVPEVMPHQYRANQNTMALGEEKVHYCGYCGYRKISASASGDGSVRIRCPCGGVRADGVLRMHSNWRSTPGETKDLDQSMVGLKCHVQGFAPMVSSRHRPHKTCKNFRRKEEDTDAGDGGITSNVD